MDISKIKTREQVIAVIDKFTAGDNWEFAYTFGHIVLDDYNLADGHIRFCLRQRTINEWFEHKLKDCNPDRSNPESDNAWERCEYDDLTEMRDKVIIFLRWLLTIPEEIRD